MLIILAKITKKVFVKPPALTEVRHLLHCPRVLRVILPMCNVRFRSVAEACRLRPATPGAVPVHSPAAGPLRHQHYL